MRRAAAALLTAVLLLTAGSCETAPKYHYEVRRDLSVYFTNADEVIASVRQALKERSPKITVTYRSHSDNMQDIPALISEIMTLAMSETDDPCEGDYIYHQYGGYETEFSCTSGDIYSYTIFIKPVWYTDPKQEEAVTERVKAIIGELIHDGMTDAERVRAVYDYVCGNVKYDLAHKKNEHYHLKTTAYAALVNGYAVCQGYSVLMYRLLREAGVNARVITGNVSGSSGTEYHAWNIAEIDGLYYNIDATWDRITGTGDRFLKCDASFSVDHFRDEAYSTDSFYAAYPMSETDYNAG